jgi:hypothetical protein
MVKISKKKYNYAIKSEKNKKSLFLLVFIVMVSLHFGKKSQKILKFDKKVLQYCN